MNSLWTEIVEIGLYFDNFDSIKKRKILLEKVCEELSKDMEIKFSFHFFYK